MIDWKSIALLMRLTP